MQIFDTFKIVIFVLTKIKIENVRLVLNLYMCMTFMSFIAYE